MLYCRLDFDVLLKGLDYPLIFKLVENSYRLYTKRQPRKISR